MENFETFIRTERGIFLGLQIIKGTKYEGKLINSTTLK